MRNVVVLLFIALLSVLAGAQPDRVTIRVDAAMSKGPWLRATDGRMTLQFDLPRQGVSLLKLAWIGAK